ncbi:MAG: VWA domain-containing protein [Actinomycetota bacterium]|nr:VWA domain-containing protein [Actinomycetota bacterium]
MTAIDGEAFSANLVHFVRYLRASGMTVGPETARDLAAAADAVGLTDRVDAYHAFKAVATVRAADAPRFDQAFELFFGAAGITDESQPDIAFTSHRDEATRGSLPTLASREQSGAETDEMVAEIGGGSHAEKLAQRDFGTLTEAEREEVRRLIARMIWRPADALSRRWVSDRRGDRPHIRKTFSNLTRPEGDLIPFEYMSRRPRRRPLIVIADISGSMELYAEMFLHFIHAAQGRLGRLEAFVFATRLSRITREMRQRDPHYALARVASSVDDWSGGTRIGEALGRFNRDWSRRVARGGAVGLIISDGWDTGDPELLDSEMARFARSVHRVVWLNPLASRAGYEPEARGMRAALPYIDDFLAASSVMDLREVVRLLESLPSRR